MSTGGGSRIPCDLCDDGTEPGVCTAAHQSWSCPNMKPVEGDRDMEYEHYECKACGRTMKLDYEEMR